MKIIHNGFGTHVPIWNKVYDGVGGWRNIA
jgi:hypothetical protein